MDTKLATTQIRLSKWADIIQDRINSGMKVDEYCDLHGLSRAAYFYWLRKVKTAALERAGFVEVPLEAAEDSGASSEEMISIFINDAEIRISGSFSADSLEKVVGVLRHVK